MRTFNKKCSQLRAHRSDVLRSVKDHPRQQSPPPPTMFSTSHDQPCAAETRGKVAALCRLETGGNWQQTNTYTPTDNTTPLLQLKNLQPVDLEHTTPTFNSLVSLKADATPFSTDSVYHPLPFSKSALHMRILPTKASCPRHKCFHSSVDLTFKRNTRSLDIYPQQIWVTWMICLPPTWPVII